MTKTRLPILLLASALAFPAAAQTNGDPEIVVTGRSLKETADDLAACLARNCPPDQDVAASLAHAENQLLQGDYKDSRTTLLKSIGRNRKHGDKFPVEVSDLFRANSRVAEHVGEAKNFQLSVLDMRNTLKAGLGEKDPRVMVAQVEVGDSRAKLGFPDEAGRIYKDVEKQALANGQNRVAMFARVRQALLIQTGAEASGLDADYAEARSALDKIIAEPLAGGEDFALVAKVMRARMDRKKGDASSTEAILKDFADKGGATRPMLLFSEPIKRIDLTDDYGNDQPQANTLQRLTALNNVAKWADVGFWINADGRVSDVEVLRSEGTKQWLKPVFKQIQTRVYAPLRRSDNDASPGFYMIERYTLTARWTEDATGTHMRRREATPRIERLDITPENYQRPVVESGPTG
ncbi:MULTISPECIES: energy transducer TonB [unclassified Sphingopyxis]|uniref:energy transducer TonB n=1 Tax=unclassified Sphingopyxis TaxID=2614943 RepID=UPI000A7C6078|nr:MULTISPECIES: hypothetical protein [unclassified Sphingopyxis]